jgi:integrase
VSSTLRLITPVALPPGRLRLATRPSATGSEPVPKTIGMLEVAALAASAPAVLAGAAITATCRRTRSAANSSKWIGSIGLDPNLFGTHSLRRTKATLIYRRTGNLRAVQLLLGHTKIESTVRYLGIEVDDALAIAEQVDV